MNARISSDINVGPCMSRAKRLFFVLPARESLICDIPTGDGETAKLLQCTELKNIFKRGYKKDVFLR